MNKISNWEQVVTKGEGGNPKLSPGVYLVRILRVEDDEQREVLKIEFDIYDGQFKDYFTNKFKMDKESPNNKGKKVMYQGTYWQTTRAENAGYLKRFITCIEHSNTGFKWNPEDPRPQSLVGKILALSFGETETRMPDGTVKMLVKPRFPYSAKAFHEGTIQTPLPRMLAHPPTTPAKFPSVNQQDITETLIDQGQRAWGEGKVKAEQPKAVAIVSTIVDDEDLPF